MQKIRPKNEKKTLEIFKVRLKEIINKAHPLVQLAKSISWNNLEENLSEKYTKKMGAPGKEIRLMVGLQYLKYMYNESDEMIVRKFVENPYYQYFCGNEYFEHSPPINPSSMTTSSKNNWIVSIQAHHDNPYDGHTLKSSIEKAEEVTTGKQKISMLT